MEWEIPVISILPCVTSQMSRMSRINLYILIDIELCINYTPIRTEYP